MHKLNLLKIHQGFGLDYNRFGRIFRTLGFSPMFFKLKKTEFLI